MTGSTSSDGPSLGPSPGRGTQPEGHRIARALMLGVALGLVLRALGRRDEGSIGAARR